MQYNHETITGDEFWIRMTVIQTLENVVDHDKCHIPDIVMIAVFQTMQHLLYMQNCDLFFSHLFIQYATKSVKSCFLYVHTVSEYIETKPDLVVSEYIETKPELICVSDKTFENLLVWSSPIAILVNLAEHKTRCYPQVMPASATYFLQKLCEIIKVYYIKQKVTTEAQVMRWLVQ